jgi:superfamily II DNA/RNA helicase
VHHVSGGSKVSKADEKKVAAGVDILIATPARLLMLMKNEKYHIISCRILVFVYFYSRLLLIVFV